jgi:hypothetical protein
VTLLLFGIFQGQNLDNLLFALLVTGPAFVGLVLLVLLFEWLADKR